MADSKCVWYIFMYMAQVLYGDWLRLREPKKKKSDKKDPDLT